MKTKVWLLNVILCIFACMCSICVFAQEIPKKARYLRIIEMNDFAYCDKVTPSESRTFFKKFVGDTIVFKGTNTRKDFIKSDTIWIKRDVKKPIKGKHYNVTTHYKSTDGDKTTPNEYVYDRPWIIVYQGLTGNNSNYLALKDIQTGDVVEWHYQDGEFGFNGDITLIDISLSHKTAIFFKNKSFYKKKGLSFEKRNINDAIASFSLNSVRLNYTTFLLTDDNTYKFPYDHSPLSEAQYNYDTLYTKVEKDKALNILKNKGYYNLVLSEVIKPQNSQIRYGK